jgi:hypothetical protein
MHKLSSDSATTASKVWVFIPLVILLLMFFLSIFYLLNGDGSVYAPIVLAGIISAYAFFSMKSILNLADEVFDDGDALVVRRGKVTVKIPLADVMWMTEKTFSSPPKC